MRCRARRTVRPAARAEISDPGNQRRPLRLDLAADRGARDHAGERHRLFDHYLLDQPEAALLQAPGPGVTELRRDLGQGAVRLVSNAPRQDPDQRLLLRRR